MALKLNGVTITVNKLNGNNVWVEYLNDVVVYDARPPLSTPQGDLADKFDYQDSMDVGGVMLISIYNSNTESVTLRGRILWNGGDFTSQYSHFSPADGYFFGDSFPPNTGLNYGLSMISQGLWINDWPSPVIVEVWFEPQSGSSRSASDKLIINVDPPLQSPLEWQYVGRYSSDPYNYDVITPAQYLYNGYADGINYLNINYPAGNYDEGFVAIIPDSISHDNFEFVVVAV